MNSLGRSFPLVIALVVLSCFQSVHADPYIVLGPSDNFALDQPRVYVEVVDGETSLGPELANTYLLDTGAQGLMHVGLAANELLAAGYDDTAAVYDETGIAGPMPYNVSAPYDLRFAGSSGTPIYTLPHVRMLSDELGNFGGFNGIIGTPALMNRVTELDMTAMKGDDPGGLGLGLGFMGVSFPDAMPAGDGHRYSVPLELRNFPQTGQRNITDPLPTYGPLPFAEVTAGNGGQDVTGSFVVDTGAQASIISTQTAISLGMDTNGNGVLDGDEVLSMVEIGGVGGTIQAPLVAMDSLAVGTDQGVDLVWTDLNVLVMDITAAPGETPLSGIFGCDLLTSGWTAAVLGAMGDIDLSGLDLLALGESGGPVPDAGYLNQVYFNFLNGDSQAGSMVLDLNAGVDNVVPEPATLLLIGIPAMAALARRRRAARRS